MLPALEVRVATLEREIRELKSRVDSAATVQDTRHTENGDRLASIEKTLTEIAVYLKIGRWVMHAVWAIGGSVATAFAMKWLGTKL